MTDLSELAKARCETLAPGLEASFVKKKDFYYSWRARPGGQGLVIHVSDYLDTAPDDVLGDFVEMVLLRALGMEWTEPQSFIDYVNTDVFVSEKRPVFVQRSRNLMRTDAGSCRSIGDSTARLLDAGLLREPDVANSYLSWTRRDSRRRLGFCATMFRVVGISSALDDPAVSDELVDYVVYHECLHLRQGYVPSHRVHTHEFRAWEHAYPGWEECEAALRDLPRRGA